MTGHLQLNLITNHNSTQVFQYPSCLLQRFQLWRNSSILNELKIRASYATAAGFPSPYRTRSLLGASARAFC